MNWLNRLWCRAFGHKRGRRLGMAVTTADGKRAQIYQCSRCLTTWVRKVKLKGSRAEWDAPTDANAK